MVPNCPCIMGQILTRKSLFSFALVTKTIFIQNLSVKVLLGGSLKFCMPREDKTLSSKTCEKHVEDKNMNQFCQSKTTNNIKIKIMCGTKLCMAESEGEGILKKCNIGIPGLCNLSFTYSFFMTSIG